MFLFVSSIPQLCATLSVSQAGSLSILGLIYSHFLGQGQQHQEQHQLIEKAGICCYGDPVEEKILVVSCHLELEEDLCEQTNRQSNTGKKSTCDLFLHLRRLGSMDRLLGMLCQYLRKQAVFGRTAYNLEEI